jgi:hypothetical protein
MWVPQAVPSGRGGREASTSQEVKNLIGLLPTPSSLTLLDTDPDIDPLFGSSDYLNLEEGEIRLDSDEEILVDEGEEFWRKFLPSDNEDLDLGHIPARGSGSGNGNDPTSQPLLYSTLDQLHTVLSQSYPRQPINTKIYSSGISPDTHSLVDKSKSLKHIITPKRLYQRRKRTRLRRN